MPPVLAWRPWQKKGFRNNHRQQQWYHRKSDSGNYNRRHLAFIYTHEEIVDAIQFYKNRGQEKIEEHEQVGRKIREQYFEPVTYETTRKFLHLN